MVTESRDHEARDHETRGHGVAWTLRVGLVRMRRGSAVCETLARYLSFGVIFCIIDFRNIIREYYNALLSYSWLSNI